MFVIDYLFDSYSKKPHKNLAIKLNHTIIATAPWQARSRLWRVADTGQDPSLPLAGVNQTQEVLSKVCYPVHKSYNLSQSFIPESVRFIHCLLSRSLD